VVARHRRDGPPVPPIVREVIIRSAAGWAVKATAALSDRVWPPARGVVVLLYHRVGAGTTSEVDLPPALFDEQMAWLAARRVAVTLDVALNSLEGVATQGDDPVVVSFDDGTADLVDVALPILVRHRIPAVFYLATDFIECSRQFPHGGAPLSWSAVSDAVSTGLVSIGSHTDTHLLLDRADSASAAADLDRSVALIEDRAGVTAVDFAYPKAVMANGDVEAVVRSRFRSAAVGGCRANPYGATDVHRLARSAIQRADGMRFFEHKAGGGMGLEDRMRQSLNRIRYARATS
jgi:peptidoglycan/xylan/chitin deacetylase (PgdA/CDA1 family)